jgi:site-specific DNA recombinase
VHQFFATRIFGPDRRQQLADALAEGDQSARQDHGRRRQALQRRATDLRRRQERLIAQLETADAIDPTDPFITGVRQRYNQLDAELREVTDQIRQLDATVAPTDRPLDLIDALPQIPALLEELPEELAHDLYAAFQLDVRYNRTGHRARLRATVTDDTPFLVPPAGFEPALPPPGGRASSELSPKLS